MTFRLDGLDHVALAVRDLDASEAWYREVLGLERVHEAVWGVPVMLMRGGSGVALFAAADVSGGPQPPVRVLHVAFRTDAASFLGAQEHLRALGIPFRFENHDDVAHSVYFADPDGHRLEITTYDLR